MRDKWGDYLTEVTERQEIVKKLSGEYDAVLVPFQSPFYKALEKAPAEYWIWDGIHPIRPGMN